MALKILLADDSMTAQNMGKKILTEAGYDIVAVSNGAAALKKIAELKPDIAILDVFMPGYTGHEGCERNSRGRQPPGSWIERYAGMGQAVPEHKQWPRS